MTGSLEEMREWSKEPLIHESRLRILLDQVSHCEVIEADLFLVVQAMPWFQQCEHWGCIKIMIILVMKGLILDDISATNQKRVGKEYLTHLQKIINTKTIGDEFDLLHWNYPND